MLKLKSLLEQFGASQVNLANAVGVSPATVAQIVNHNIWPKRIDNEQLKKGINFYLKAIGVDQYDRKQALEVADEPCANTEHPPVTTTTQEEVMLLRKEGLSQATRKHFGLFRDPFDNDIQSTDDVFKSPDVRYVLDTMVHTAKHGGFVAVVGESGSGKSTVREEMEDWLLSYATNIIMIKPFVIGMEGDDAKGKRLKAASILDAILRRLSPDKPRRSLSLEDKSNAAAEALLASYQAGNRHCLVIEEAHRLAKPTLRHLKGFYEMKIVRTPLLSILLVGQTELGDMLNPSNSELREVTQRCQVIRLDALDGRLEEYIKFKFDRIGKPMSEVLDNDCIDAVRARLMVNTGRRGVANNQETVSLLYPQAVGNLLSAAMNLAAELGAPKVSADIVKAV